MTLLLYNMASSQPNYNIQNSPITFNNVGRDQVNICKAHYIWDEVLC
jgi:hypothetical protein